MKAFIVGGWVRDKILGIVSQDKDWVVVGATPEDLLCQNFKQVGASFPVFLHPLTQEEYALARTERKTGSGYHGFSVSFDKTVTLEEDLLRRDLSINAIAFDVDNEIYVDPFGGIQDLENKVLRHVSDAFSEDPLRIVRLARFHSLFADFSIDQNLLQLVEKMIADSVLKELAKERIIKEFEKAHQAQHQIEIFWKHCFEWKILDQVFDQSFCLWKDIESYFNFYEKKLVALNAADRLAVALAFYELAACQKSGLSKNFSNKTALTVSFVKRTFFLKQHWSLDTFVDFIIQSRLLHQEKRTLFADFFLLPLSNKQITQLLEIIYREDKTSWINKDLKISPSIQLKENLKKVIISGQYKDFFE